MMRTTAAKRLCGRPCAGRALCGSGGCHAAAVLFLIAALAGCAKTSTPVSPAPPLPPTVDSVFPAARSVDVPVDTQIWAEFDEDLDPTSLTTSAVQLTRDARHIPALVSWDPLTRRVHVVPQVPLELLRTHTVTFTSEVRAADGTALGGEFFWQFKTNSVRRPADPFPPVGASFESPYARMSWRATEPDAGAVRYSLYASSDSAMVAARAVAAFATSNTALYLPTQPWALGTSFFWAVDVTNLVTQESAQGPVWRFDTIPVGTPVDSLRLPALQWASIRHYSGYGDFGSCFGSTIASGTNRVAAIDWDLGALGANARLADASMRMSPSYSTIPSGRTLVLLGAADPWMACSIAFPGPPFVDDTLGTLATATVISSTRLRFSSARLTAHIEARMRGIALDGYVLQTDGSTFTYASPAATDASRRPELVVKYYVIPPAASGETP